MKLNQLRYFVAVCKAGSIVAAAQNLYVSRPAISQTINDLEDEFNVNLFIRNNNKIELTEDGKWLYEKAETLLKNVDALEAELHARSSCKYFVNVGVAPMFGNIYLYKVLNSLRQVRPDLQINIEEAGSFEIRKWVENDTVDFGVCVLWDDIPQKIASQKLTEVELKFFVHKSHPLARKKELDFRDLDGQKICLLKKDSWQNVFVQRKLEEAGVNYEVMLHSSQLSTIVTMLGYGNCGAFLFGDEENYSPSVVAIPMKQPMRLSIGMIWSNEKKFSKQANAVRRYIAAQYN